jgi:hypothetical protein
MTPLSAFFGVSRVLPETIENNRSISLAFIAFSFNFKFFRLQVVNYNLKLT